MQQIKASEPIDDGLVVITIEDDEYEPVEGVHNPKSIADEDGNRIFEYLEELARLSRSASIGSDSQNVLNRRQETTEELHLTLDAHSRREQSYAENCWRRRRRWQWDQVPANFAQRRPARVRRNYLSGAVYLLSAAHCFIDKKDDPKTVYVPIIYNSTWGDNVLGDIVVLFFT